MAEALVLIAVGWVVTNYVPIVAVLGGVVGEESVRRGILNKMLKKRNIRKLIKYVTDEDNQHFIETIIGSLKEYDYAVIKRMKNRIKKYKKSFKKFNFLDIDENVLLSLINALQDDKKFKEYNNKFELIENIIEMLIITRKTNSPKRRKHIFKNILKVLIDTDLTTLKKIGYYISANESVFYKSMFQEDVVGYLEIHLEKADEKNTVIQLLNEVNYDIEKKIVHQFVSASVSKSPSLSNENVLEEKKGLFGRDLYKKRR